MNYCDISSTNYIMNYSEISSCQKERTMVYRNCQKINTVTGYICCEIVRVSFTK